MSEGTRDATNYLYKEACPACGSSDALARYDDGHGWCFSCNAYEPATGDTPRKAAPRMSNSDFVEGPFKSLDKRRITEETCRKFHYTVTQAQGRTVQVASYYDPEGNAVVFQKIRFPDKTFIARGDMINAGLYGQHLWGSGGKMIVVTEGEIDAMTVSQVQGNKWPVVSVPNGAAGAAKAIKRQLEWLSSFDTVVLMFDNDEPGKEAAAECASLFPPGKCKVATLPMKDPNEMLQAGRQGDIISAMWNAKLYRPDGLVKLSDIRESMAAPIVPGLPWVFPALSNLTYGRRYGEVYALGAGTGVGKTDFLTQQIAFDLTELKQKVGIFFLEQQPEESGKRIAGKVAGRLFHVPDSGWTPEELTATVEGLVATDDLFLYDHFGTTDWDIIKSRIRFLAISEGVRIFYLDHLTALAAAEDDERKALERIMSEIGGLVKELDIMMVIVSHLATPEGKPHEEGGRVMIRHFKGSRAIGFWCHFMFGLERNQQATDIAERKTTTFRCLKDRYTGRSTGETFFLGYDTEKGLLFETTAVPEFKDETTNASSPDF